jgi:poly(3-hydroxybutyrate) depolymerase
MIFLNAFLLLTSVSLPTSALPERRDLTARASSGCGKKPFLPTIPQPRIVKSSGKVRSYSYHLPSSYDPNKPYPIVLGFHGSSSVGVFFELDTKMDHKSYSGDKIMVYPNGVGGSWAGPTYHEKSTVAEDVQFVKDVIGEVKDSFCVDEEKVFGVG